MKSGMDELAKKSQECIDKAAPALLRAEEVATKLKLNPNAIELKRIREELARDRFSVMIFGRFKCGKSVILNALLGKSPVPIPGMKPGDDGPMPVDINPATAVPTKIYYAEKPEVFAIKKGKRYPWDFEKYVAQAKQKTSKEETDLFFRDIEGFEVGYPTPFCKGGVDLYDTPGTDDNAAMDLQTFQAAKTVDAAILALAHPGTAGMQELRYIDDLMASGMRSFLTIVNARDPDPPYQVAMPPSPDTIAVTWNRLVAPIKKRPQYKGQRLESEDVFFMNAKQAFRGRIKDDEKAVQVSGILAFEARLAEYLQAEPRIVHLQRFLGAAEPVLISIEQAISKECSGLDEKQQISQAKMAELLQKLAEVPKRARRIPDIIKYACGKSQTSVRASMEQLYFDIEQDLPTHMASQPLPSLHKEGFWENLKETATAKFRQKHLVEEAQNIALAYVRSRVERWLDAPVDENGAPRALQMHLDNMVEDLRAEAAAIERQYAQAQFELTGWTVPDASAEFKAASLANRVTAAAFGVVTGQLDYIAVGGLGGWGAIGKDMLARIAIAAPLMFIFNVSLPVALPIAIVAGVVWSMLGGVEKLENSIKETTIRTLLKGTDGNEKEGIPPFAGLANEPRKQRNTIAAAVQKKFDEIEARVMKVVNDQIQTEEQSLRNQQENMMRDATGRMEKLAELKGYMAQIQKSRGELKQAWASAAQPGAQRSAQTA